ncbi:MAG: M48 family metalloprotease [Pseudomonadota bacterium]
MPSPSKTLFLALAFSLGLAACAAPTAQNTETSLQQERQASEQVVRQLEEKNALMKDQRLNTYLRGVVNRVARERPPGSVPLKTYVVRDADVNAFTTGGGYLFFNAGMLAAMENEAQLASVAAHEIAHIDRGHVQAGRANRQGVQLGAAAAAIGGSLLGVPGDLINLGVGLGANYAVNSFSRTQESDADETGIQYLAAAGYNAAEGAKSFAVLRRLYGSQTGAQALFFASHPSSGDRLQTLTRRASELGATKGRVGRDTHDAATRALRRDILKFYNSEGRDKEAQQIRRNLRR